MNGTDELPTNLTNIRGRVAGQPNLDLNIEWQAKQISTAIFLSHLIEDFGWSQTAIVSVMQAIVGDFNVSLSYMVRNACLLPSRNQEEPRLAKAFLDVIRAPVVSPHSGEFSDISWQPPLSNQPPLNQACRPRILSSFRFA
jgi:hypothetical protein